MNTTFTKTALAIATVFSIASSALAQSPVNSPFDSMQNSTAQFQTTQPQFQAVPQQQAAQAEPAFGRPTANYVQPSLPAIPPSCQYLPKLQFDGRLIHGVGMQVVSVNLGGVAQQVGLEPGDIIVSIDGRRIDHASDYEDALLKAAIYNDGHVDLVVRNVRYRPGCTLNREFVAIHADLPKVCLVPAVVAAR